MFLIQEYSTVDGKINTIFTKFFAYTIEDANEAKALFEAKYADFKEKQQEWWEERDTMFELNNSKVIDDSILLTQLDEINARYQYEDKYRDGNYFIEIVALEVCNS